jgi:two-component system, OmpR family, phosphate regulon sensor histidine kinase PhoR
MPVLNFPWRRAAPPVRAEATVSAPSQDLALFAAALEVLPDAVLIVRREGTAPAKILASNAAAREMLRIRAEEEQLVSVLRHPDVLAAVEDTLTTDQENTLSYETGGLRSQTLHVWVRSLLPTLGTVLIVLRDETDARRIERMRVDFLANASHELRTPLASLSGFIETLQGHAKQDSEARDRFLDIMAAQAKRMSRLIDDLLSLSRIERNEHVPPSGTCDLSLAAREAADGLLPAIAAKDKRIELLAPIPGEALAIGEHDQIAQVVQNLVDNAVKYSPEDATISVSVEPNMPFDPDAAATDLEALRDSGGGRLNLVSPERGHENRYVRLRVTDRGRGIARAHLPRLTERFYRVPGQKTGEITGTGLGLAIVKHIVNRHHGALVVESAPGLGTTFTVYFRSAAGEAAPVSVVTKPL